MKHIFTSILILFILISSNVFSQRYAFDQIPDELKVGANAVYRADEMVYTVESPRKSKLKRKVAITLLNETAEDYRFPDLNYSQFEKLSGIKGNIYDENGKLIEVLKSSSMLDRSIAIGGSFHSDFRVKTLLFPLMKYPYTIEYEYEISINGIINYPTWSFQRSRYASVETSGVQYIVPEDIEVKFLEVNLPVKIDSLSYDKKRIYTWKMDNIPAMQTNPYGNSLYSYPLLYATPKEFEIDGYKGSTDSWESFGKWNKQMIEDRDKLPESEIKKIKELVSGVSDERQKVKIIYEYMQSKTRYMNIILGIGGWQPIPAADVATKGYGDCKALSNYTMALLKAVGIKSHYTLINSGLNEDIYPNFVSNQFNHVILCVPQQNDTIWLECTNQTYPFNYLGISNTDRYALLIDENGGKVVRTPEFSKADNVIKRTGEVIVRPANSDSKASINTYTSGVFYGYSFGSYGQQSEEGIKRQLNKSLSYHTFDVEKASFTFDKSEKPSAVLSYNLTIKNLASESATRLFFAPTIDKENYLVDEPFKIRISEYTTELDSIAYQIPSGYEVEYLPSSKVVETKYGKYIYDLKLTEGKIIFTRSLELNKGQYPIDDFNDFHDFISVIAKTDRENIILRKKQV